MRNTLIVICTVAASVSPAAAQSAADLVLQGDQLEKDRKEEAALAKYKDALKLEPTNLDALCGASFMCSRVGNRQTSKTLKEAYFKTAKIYAEGALKKNPGSAEANYVMAVAMGRLALISGSKDKVAASRDIYKYAQKAVQINPRYALAWNVLGKYNYEVSNLNFAEKGAANMLFGGLPPGDLKTAIANYEKCKSLDPGFILNLLDLGKAYKQNDQKDKAKAVWQQAINTPVRTQDDPENIAECKKLLGSL